MKIDSSVIKLASNFSKIQYYKKDESITITGMKEDENQNAKNPMDDTVEISKEGEKKLEEDTLVSKMIDDINDVDNMNDVDNIKFELDEKSKEKIALLEKFLEMITGKKIKIKIFDDEVMKDKKENMHIVELNLFPKRKKININHTKNERHYEKQNLEFSSEGNVKTGDGRDIKFKVNFSMSREYYNDNNTDVRTRKNLVDPLVINFDTQIAGLSDEKFQFDINSDGEKENIAQLSKGSGFLAVDKNSDGVINDGNELFGTESGNGFKDLKLYDTDNNNWIDENDEIFKDLKIWVKNDEGNDIL
ncbi:MAG: hypothetical protein ABF289_20075, partial [Clostridiales bacterium]